MNRRLLAILSAAIISALTITSCSKNDDAPGGGGGNLTKEKLTGSYKLTELKEVSPDGTFDYLENYSSCERDNLFVLKADMTLAVVDAGEQCNPSSDDTGTWEFPGSNTIVLNGEEFTIKSMDGTTLKMADTYTVGGVEKTLNVTYVRQ